MVLRQLLAMVRRQLAEDNEQRLLENSWFYQGYVSNDDDNLRQNWRFGSVQRAVWHQNAAGQDRFLHRQILFP